MIAGFLDLSDELALATAYVLLAIRSTVLMRTRFGSRLDDWMDATELVGWDADARDKVDGSINSNPRVSAASTRSCLGETCYRGTCCNPGGCFSAIPPTSKHFLLDIACGPVSTVSWATLFIRVLGVE